MNETTELLKIVKELLQSLPGSIALIGGAIMLLYWHWVKHRHLFDGQRLRVERIQSYLKDGGVADEALRRILSEERDEQVFAHVFGYRADAVTRNLMHAIVRADGSPVNSWRKAKKVEAYIHVVDAKLVVRLSRLDKAMHIIQRVYVAALLALTALVAGLLLVEIATKGRDVLTAFLTLVVMFIVLFLMALSDSGVGTALKLERWLKEQERRTNGASADAITK